MRTYSIGQLAKLAGVTIRTLRYYDKIDLLKPANRTDSNYRYYGKEELYRLQQILFFKELDFDLKKIKKILDDSDFDLINALAFHRKKLNSRKERLEQLLETIDKTIKEIREENTMLTDEELYEGFSKREIQNIKKEVAEKYDPEVVAESNLNVRKMSKSDLNAIKGEQIQQAKDLANLMDKAVDSKHVQDVIKRHHQINERFYKTNAEMYKGLGDMYVSDARFTEFYNRHKPGLAEFLRNAMHHYAEENL
ncbi:MAG: MerR family transcriptional regulator [Balneola sp.]